MFSETMGYIGEHTRYEREFKLYRLSCEKV